jgi:hypothetical protein
MYSFDQYKDGILSFKLVKKEETKKRHQKRLKLPESIYQVNKT